jgi:glutamate racemase
MNRYRFNITKGRTFEPCNWVIEPRVRKAVESTKNKKVGVIGTDATITESGAYTRALKEANQRLRSTGRACPLFVPLIEEGWTDNAVVGMTAERI